jgi:hypothetical protein
VWLPELHRSSQPFCQNCGQQFQYNCPSCRAIVDSRFNVCPNCRATLNWPTYHQTNKQAEYTQGYSIDEKKTKERSGLKISALILGILGGLGGLAGAIFVLVFGGIGIVLGGEGAKTIVGLGWAAIPISFIGIIGAAMATTKAKIAGTLMLLSGIGGFIAISAGYLIGGPFLIIGGILALVARN